MGFNLSFGNFSYPYLGAQLISVQKLRGFLIFLAQIPDFTLPIKEDTKTRIFGYSYTYLGNKSYRKMHSLSSKTANYFT